MTTLKLEHFGNLTLQKVIHTHLFPLNLTIVMTFIVAKAPSSVTCGLLKEYNDHQPWLPSQLAQEFYWFNFKILFLVCEDGNGQSLCVFQ